MGETEKESWLHWKESIEKSSILNITMLYSGPGLMGAPLLFKTSTHNAFFTPFAPITAEDYPP